MLDFALLVFFTGSSDNTMQLCTNDKLRALFWYLWVWATVNNSVEVLHFAENPTDFWEVNLPFPLFQFILISRPQWLFFI